MLLPPQRHPRRHRGFFLAPTQAADWVQANAGDPRAGVRGDRIADVPSSIWLTGRRGVPPHPGRSPPPWPAEQSVVGSATVAARWLQPRRKVRE